jgi:NAD(P)-dependent dehydrogenase (short-subunit alcohol dehydrogenase family)
METINKKYAVVTGGTSGIGKAIALELSKKGDISVMIVGRNEEEGALIV